MAGREKSARQAADLEFPLTRSLGNQIRLTSRLFDRAMSNRLKALEIPYGIWGFLRHLWHRDGQTQLELASALELSGATTVTAIDRMEGLGLIRRERSSKDRRNVHIYLSKKGKALRVQLLPVAIEVNELAVSQISAHDLEHFSKVLDLIQAVLRKDEEQLAHESRKSRLRQKLRTLE